MKNYPCFKIAQFHHGILSMIAFERFLTESSKSYGDKPKEINDVLINPGIGFNTFQMFNGDNLAPNQDVLREANVEQFRHTGSSMKNDHYPQTSTAYFRILWSVIEPERDVYRWDYIDSLLALAHEHGQTLLLRIAPYKGRPIDDVPAWYRELVGPKRDFKHIKWPVDPENPLYAECFGNMIRELGKRYDGHPDLESVDVSIVGWAGEGGGTNLLSTGTMHRLMDAYIESFKKTQLIALLTGEESVEYLKSKANVGWRQDCLGDLGFWADEQNGWTHMYDYYPMAIVNYGMSDAWRTAPVTFEICGTCGYWQKKEGYDEADVQYIIDQSLKWHISSFNAKSSPVPEEWNPLMDEWLKKMGYRFVLRRLAYPDTVKVNGKLPFQTWWENKGVAPIYRYYTLAIRLKKGNEEYLLPTCANITQWMPGDNVFDDAVFVPFGATPGTYKVEMAILDPVSRKPAVKLAIEGMQEDGWYSLGTVEVAE